MTYFFFLISLLSWPFGQLLTFQVQGISTPVYFLDIAIGLTAISLFLSSQNRKQILKDPIFKPLLIFLIAASLSLLVNLQSQARGNMLVSVFYLLRLFIYPAGYFALRLTSFKRLRFPLTLSVILFCVFAVTQYLFMPDMTFLGLIGFDNHYYRLIGTFFDPNFTGAILSGLALFLIASQSLIFSVFAIILLALTFSRASYISFVTGLIYILVKQKKLKYLGMLAILGVAIVLVPKPFGEGVNLTRTFSIFTRLDSWKVGIDLFFQKPIIGWGYNTLRSIAGSRFQIDNSFIQIAATTGLLGLSAFLNLLYQCSKQIKRLPEQIFLLSILTHSFFNNTLLYIWVLFACFVVLGLATKEYKQS